MKRIQPLAVIAAGLVLAGAAERAGAALATTFTGAFAPANWTVGGSGGSAVSFGLNGQGYGTLDWTAPAASAYAISLSITPSPTTFYNFDFNWQMENNGDSGTPQVTYAVETPGNTVYGGESGTLTGNGASGLVNLDIPAGDTLVFDFIGAGTKPGKDPATFDATLIPEPAAWMAGALVLGFVAVSVIRRKLAGT